MVFTITNLTTEDIARIMTAIDKQIDHFKIKEAGALEITKAHWRNELEEYKKIYKKIDDFEVQ